MFQKGVEIIFSEGSPSNFANNLSVYRDDGSNITYASFAHINQANTLQWGADADYSSNGSIFLQAKVVAKSSTVTQTKICVPSSTKTPYLAIASTTGAMVETLHVYSLVNETVLAWFPLSVLLSTEGNAKKPCYFTKGIACIDDFVLTGTSNGHIIVFDCSKANSVSFKKVIAEHTCAIVDLAACQQEKLFCSCDVSGRIVVWEKGLRSIQKKINTKLNFTCINVVGKKIVAGTFSGKVVFFCSTTGNLLIDVNAHIRQINAIVISKSTFQMITVSEDSFFRIWDLHDVKDEPGKIECVQTERLENKSLIGAQFLNDEGTALAVAAYDYSKLYVYEIPKV